MNIWLAWYRLSSLTFQGKSRTSNDQGVMIVYYSLEWLTPWGNIFGYRYAYIMLLPFCGYWTGYIAIIIAS